MAMEYKVFKFIKLWFSSKKMKVTISNTSIIFLLKTRSTNRSKCDIDGHFPITKVKVKVKLFFIVVSESEGN